MSHISSQTQIVRGFDEGAASIPSVPSLDSPEPTVCPCIRIATDQIGQIGDLREFINVTTSDGNFWWRGATSLAIGKHVKYLYEDLGGGQFQQYIIMSNWNGIDFIDGESLEVSDSSSGPWATNPHQDVRSTGLGGADQQTVDCDTGQPCEATSGVIDVTQPYPVDNTPNAPFDPNASTPDAQQNKIGMNLAEISFFGGHIPWKNAFLVSGASAADGWQQFGAGSFTVDSDGNLTTLSGTVGTFMFRDIGGHYPTGRYVCLYDADGTDLAAAGTIDLGGNALLDFSSTSAGRFEFDLTAGNNAIEFYVFGPVPAAPNNLRNIRIVHEDDEATYASQPWNDDFLDFCTGFNTLRFMDWQPTNGSDLVDFADRVPDTYRTYGQNGVPYEQWCDLCNEVQANMWVCVPHQATDAFVTSLATLLHANLDSNLRIYVEYSNEVWNGGFAQYSYAVAQSITRGLHPGGAANDYLGAARFHGQRSAEIWALFNAVTGSSRIVRVLGSQYDVGDAYWAARGLETAATAGGFVYQTCDAVAIAPYWGAHLGLDSSAVVADPSAYSAWNPSDPTHSIIHLMVADHINDHSEFTVGNYLGDLLGTPEYAGIRLIAYEGGQHLVGVGSVVANSAVTQLFLSANRHAEMFGAYQNAIQDWMTDVDDLFVAYHGMGPYGQNGSWGVREFQDTPLADAHKERAIRTFMSAQPLLSQDVLYSELVTLEIEAHTPLASDSYDYGPITVESRDRVPSPSAQFVGFGRNLVTGYFVVLTNAMLATDGSWFLPGEFLKMTRGDGVDLGVNPQLEAAHGFQDLKGSNVNDIENYSKT